MPSPFPGMDPFVELQQAFEQTYERGGYDYTLDDARDVVPELNGAERQWVHDQLEELDSHRF